MGDSTVPIGAPASGTQPAQTRATIRWDIRQRLGEDLADFWSDTYLNRLINEAQRRFTREEQWPWLFTVRTGVVMAAGATSLLLEKDVTFNRHFDLLYTVAGSTTPVFPKRVLPANAAHLRVGRSTAGDPAYYYLSHSQGGTGADTETHLWYARFIPIPSRDITLEYQYLRAPLDLLSDGEELDVPREYVEAVASWATAQAWLRELNGSAKAQEQFNLYQAVLAQAKKDMGAHPLDTELVWGGEEPRTSRQSQADWVRARIPNQLGP